MSIFKKRDYLKVTKHLTIAITALVLSWIVTVGSLAVSPAHTQPHRLFAIDIAKSSNPLSPKAGNVSLTTAFMNLESIVGRHTVKLNLDRIRKQHPASSQIGVSLRRAQDAKRFGEYTLSLRPLPNTGTMIPNNATRGELTFRYLPERFFIEVTTGVGTASRTIEKTDIIQHTLLKTIITDRDRKEAYQGKLQQRQKTFLIEGDRFNPWGYIVAWSLVSTGKPNMDKHPGNYTPLGYYYVKSKEENAYNDRDGRMWKMPYALWYTKKSGTPEGTNGLHAFEKTQFGTETSHGCTREPAAFAQAAFAWCDIGTPVVIIGNQPKHHQDKNRFYLADYPLFQTLLTELLDFRHQIDAGQYEQSVLTKEQTETLAGRRPLLEEMRRRPFRKEKHPGNAPTL